MQLPLNRYDLYIRYRHRCLAVWQVSDLLGVHWDVQDGCSVVVIIDVVSSYGSSFAIAILGFAWKMPVCQAIVVVSKGFDDLKRESKPRSGQL